MKQRITLIIGTILLICVSQLQAQENEKSEVAFAFTINDLNDKPLTGMLTASIEVNRSGDTSYMSNLFLGSGSVRGTELLDMQAGDSGTIMITYNPAEEPRNIYANTPIVDDIQFVSNNIHFTLPENKELLFKISFASKELEVISSTKTGASKAVTNSKEVSSSMKAYGELEASAWIVTAKAGIESEDAESETNAITDTEMKEDEKAIRYSVKVATGALIIEQK
tara:strand:- start:124 stop:795 length:672 start_codon:yes stop_codon:yes gene_type:complete